MRRRWHYWRAWPLENEGSRDSLTTSRTFGYWAASPSLTGSETNTSAAIVWIARLEKVARWAAMGRGSAGEPELRGRVGFLVLWVVRDGGLGSKYPIKGVRQLLQGQLVRTGGSFVRDARRGSCR